MEPTICVYNNMVTSGTAQGGGGSFKIRKPIGEVPLSLTTYLPTYLSIYVSIFRLIDRSIYLSIYLSVYLSICLSACLSVCLTVSFKTQQFRETSSIFELDNIKNETILRDFLIFRS